VTLVDAREDRRADLLLQEAMAAYRAGKFAEAEVHCRNILKRDPDHIAGLQVLAAVAGQFGVPRRGIELVHKIINLKPDHIDAHIQLAKLWRQDGKDEQAIAALKKAIEIAPESAAAYNDLGLIYLSQADIGEAAKCFDRAIELKPGMAIAHFNKGLTLERRGLHQEAMAAFRQVLAIDPDFAQAEAKLGNLLFADNQMSEAFDCFRRAASAKPDTAVGLMCQARIFLEEGKPAAAEETVRRAIARDPQNSDAHALLGTILMELGRFDDAAVAADLSIALNRLQIPSYHELVNAKKLSERDRPLVRHLEWMLKEYGLEDQARSAILFALGKALDDLGDYENAIRNFDEANRLKHRRFPCNHAAYAAGIDKQIARFDADFFSRNAAIGTDCELPIFILGMPRSGTTLVEQILSSHPEVAAGGELAFWREHAQRFRWNPAGNIDPAWVGETAREYEALLAGFSPTARRVTDKMPHNFNFIAPIHSAFPRARIIHCRRHPVDTCLSIYFQNFARAMDFAYDRGDLLSHYRQYLRLMAHWRSVLPSDCFLEVQYEELVAHPEPLTRTMIEFCGLDWDDACLHHERNEHPVRTASLWQARQPVYRTSVARWRNYEPWLGPLQELLSDADRASASPSIHSPSPSPEVSTTSAV
jgi:tetratricopeptide (TPR) repeat protein